MFGRHLGLLLKTRKPRVPVGAPELARLARVKDWWQQYSGAIPEWFQFYVGLEAAASAMQEYNAELVTGLLQTEPYIRAVMAAAMRADTNGDEMERQIKVRMERQKRLTAAGRAHAVGGAERGRAAPPGRRPRVMRDQLAHIAERRRAGQRDRAGAAVHGGRAPGDARLVHADAVPRPRGPRCGVPGGRDRRAVPGEAEDVRRYSLILDYLRAQALGPAESRALIAQLAKRNGEIARQDRKLRR